MIVLRGGLFSLEEVFRYRGFRILFEEFSHHVFQFGYFFRSLHSVVMWSVALPSDAVPQTFLRHFPIHDFVHFVLFLSFFRYYWRRSVESSAEVFVFFVWCEEVDMEDVMDFHGAWEF